MGSWRDKLTGGRGFDQPSVISVLVSLHAVMRLDSIPNCDDDIMIDVRNLIGFAVRLEFASRQQTCNQRRSSGYKTRPSEGVRVLQAGFLGNGVRRIRCSSTTAKWPAQSSRLSSAATAARATYADDRMEMRKRMIPLSAGSFRRNANSPKSMSECNDDPLFALRPIKNLHIADSW